MLEDGRETSQYMELLQNYSLNNQSVLLYFLRFRTGTNMLVRPTILSADVSTQSIAFSAFDFATFAYGLAARASLHLHPSSLLTPFSNRSSQGAKRRTPPKAGPLLLLLLGSLGGCEDGMHRLSQIASPNTSAVNSKADAMMLLHAAAPIQRCWRN
jgi:hypothetical protein